MKSKDPPPTKLDSGKFRKELIRIMPGYKWTVHKSYDDTLYLEATGIQSSGFNRMSTLQVEKRWKTGERTGERITYQVKSAGFGLRAPWFAENTDVTLASALRGLQNHYERIAALYGRHAGDLRLGRTKPTEEAK